MKKFLVLMTLFLYVELTGAELRELYFTNDQTVSITPPAGPEVMRDWNPYITADFFLDL